jgi:hypothetical protein
MEASILEQQAREKSEDTKLLQDFCEALGKQKLEKS